MPKTKPKKSKPEKKPTSARLLKHRPVDPEPPEATEREPLEQADDNELEAELLKTPDNAGKRIPGPRQKRLPEMEDPAIQELESSAEEYAGVRDRRMALTEEEVELKDDLLTLMHKHDKKKYVHNGIEIRVVAKDETVKVKIAKDK